MALVTLQRSPTPSVASSASTATTTGTGTTGAAAAAAAGEDLTSDEDRRADLSLSESFVLVKGAALFLQQGSNAQDPKTPTHHKNAGDLPEHLQTMINTLRCEDRIKLAVRLESVWSDHIRYMVVLYTNGRQDTEENVLLGVDFTDNDSKSCSIGMVLPLWSDTKIHLDGDGGFSISTAGRTHVFKPVSVQAMWSALQVLHRACEVSRRYNYFTGGSALTWVGFYESCISSEQSCINEWNAMSDLESTRPDSPAIFSDQPTERERAECLIRTKLRSIMMFQDLENITSKEIRNELEQHMSWDLREYKEFIDNEMLLILGQMDKATLIFDHLYLGSEWNASNLEELRECGIGYILNVTREIDNFFPEIFCYYNVRVYDDEATDLLAHWNETYNFIAKAKKNDSKCLVHCKMGVSRSASTVIAYAMKEYGWSLEKAYNFVKQKRSIAQPNITFMRQLAEYEGILDASKQRHNKLWQPEGDNDDDSPLERLQASGCSSSSGETPRPSDSEFFCPWAHEGARATPCCGDEPSDHLNYNYYFRRLSDTALDSEPSTPVRGPPLLGMERVFIEIEDVERDALLDDEGFSATHLAPPGEGTAAQTCGRLEPLEDMRLRLEFSTVEEEDEEEAQKEEAEMAALARGEETPGTREELSLANPNRFNNENANNSNRLAAKRSCPSGFDDSASSGNPHKVKPSYQPPCRDCLRVPSGRRCDRRPHRLLFPRHVGHPTLVLHPPRSGPFCPGLPNQPSSQQRRCGGQCRISSSSSSTSVVPAVGLDAYRQRLASPMGCEELPRIFRGPPVPDDDTNELQEMEDEDDDGPKLVPTGPEAELTLLKLSLRCERPTAELDEGAHTHQGSLVLPHTSAQSEQMDLGSDEVPPEDMEVDSSLVSQPFSKQFNPKFLPGSSSLFHLHHQTLKRSSSSDSVRTSARAGNPISVRQRAREIETRVRLAGLTTPSRLKRSNSLAKLGGIAISTRDLSFSGDTAETDDDIPDLPTTSQLQTFPG